MKWFYHIPISRKLFLVFTAVCLIMGGIGFLGITSLIKMNADMKAMYHDRFVPVIQLMTVNKAISENTVLLMNAASLNQNYNKLEKSVILNIELAKENIEAYGKLAKDHEERTLLNSLKTLLMAYESNMKDALNLVKNKDEMALVIKINGTASQKTAIEEKINALVEIQDAKSENLYRQSESRFIESRNVTILLICAGTFLSLSFCTVLARMISGPINQVKNKLADMSKAGGDLTQRLQVLSKDEVGQLAHECNVMLATIQGIMKEVLHQTKLVADTSSELVAKARQTSRSSEEIGMAIKEIAAGAETQVGSITETSISINQMSSGIQQISASTQEVTATAKFAQEAAENGRKTIDQSIDKMETVTAAVLQSSELMKHLSKRSHEIGKVIHVIAGIANQTNLLSLNAGIEAARASEHGRGFVVVANEIRKLAEESRQAADQIAFMINEIQQETTRVAEFLVTETRNVQAGLAAAKESRKSFQQIHEAIEAVTMQVTEVSAAVVEMAAGSEEVLHSVETIVQIANTASVETQKVRRATEESRVIMDQMVSSIYSMMEISKRLQKLVEQFKV
jgi:methyl-accepting chemotaxis protein